MSAVWYDIALDADPDNPEWYDIERIYCFDWEAFSNTEWNTLASIYKQLPHYYPYDFEGCPRWYSPIDDAQNGYLIASVEPTGLQVFGTLRWLDWRNWDQEFQNRIVSLPFRSLNAD